MDSQTTMTTASPTRRLFAGSVSVQQNHFEPAFVRIPKEGQRCPFTGLTRSGMFQFIRKGLVKSHCVAVPGAKRGVRLIDAQSLKAAIQSFGNKPENTNE